MTFKSTGIAFILSLCIICLLSVLAGISMLWILAIAFVFSLVLAYGSATIQSGFYIKAYCNSDTNEKLIALTFDDGPHPEFTSKILAVLKQHQAKATFFVIGKHIHLNESIIKQIDSEGHTIGNHTFSHSFFIDFESTKGFKKELNDTADLVKSITGKQMKLFRPPYGVTTPNLAKASRALNYHVIGWNIRSMDTTGDNKEVILNRVKQQLKPGAIVLFHDTSEKTVEVLEQTLLFAKQNGFKIVSLQSLLNINSYH